MLRKTFVGGRMNLDDDERLLKNGEYRIAENFLTVSSEGSDLGAGENPLSNKQLTNLDFTGEVHLIGKYADEKNDLIYWFVKDDNGCYLLEWDNTNETITFVLKDTRTEDDERVLNLKEDKLITGISKVITEEKDSDLLAWTDDNIEPCCINIERAKTYGENGFDIEDIYLIKKPPRYAPIITPTYIESGGNNMEDKFLLFAYRYKYLDGEYSALSDYTNYSFFPKDFELDYYELDNLGMVNAFNAVKIDFKTGDKRVTDVQLVVKKSNSTTPYIIETFNKKEKGWFNDETKFYFFSNSKKYIALPESELYRSFDNVPLKAKALTLIENIPVFGNYVEGRNLVDKNGDDIRIDFTTALKTNLITEAFDFESTFPTNNTFSFENTTGEELSTGKRITFGITVEIGDITIYERVFFFIIEEDYSNLEELTNSISFQSLVQTINNDYTSTYNSTDQYPVDPAYAVTTDTSITFSIVNGLPTFEVTPIYYEDTNNGNEEVIVNPSFNEFSYVTISENINASSCKTNRNYEVALLYEDNFNRRTPALTSENNTLYIKQRYSIFKNTIKVEINNPPPAWADRYKLVVKTPKLTYQTIYVNEFYNSGSYVWAKLEAENKDKVEVGDTLIVKVAGEIVPAEPFEVKVLKKENKAYNFLQTNFDVNGNPIAESSGTYMLIRPNKFSMDQNDYSIHQTEAGDSGSSNFPVNYLSLFSSDDNPPEELAITQGASIYVYINSSRDYDDGWTNITYEKRFTTQRPYDTFEEWINENLLNGSYLAGYDQDGNIYDYRYNLSLKRGDALTLYGSMVGVQTNPDGKLWLRIIGLLSGGTKGRSGYCRAKIVVRNSKGFYVFETKPNSIDSETFYETSQTFDIVNGNHTSNNQNQDTDTLTPAIVDLDFFNCYTQGNGVESFRFKDRFNSEYLHIDSRPTSTLIERYKQIRRFADLTYGGAFIESSGINNMNVFNASTGNFKELDKQFASVQKLFSRETNLVVLQEDKASKVLFGKDLITMADGGTAVSTTSKILGQQVPYPGENGIGLNPESFAVDTYQIYYLNPRRGTPIRLSNDGTTEINYKMVDFFRDLFSKNPSSKKVGGYDPYFKQYIFSWEEEDQKNFLAQCGNTIYKNISEPFTYSFLLNNLNGDIVIDYNIENGEANISTLFNGSINLVNGATGIGNISFERDTLEENIVTVTITPVSDEVDITLNHTCPVGLPMKIVKIVLNDEYHLNRIINNKHRWGLGSFFTDTHVFEDNPISKFEEINGLEGLGQFPQRGSTVEIQSHKDSISNARLETNKCNRLGYLVTDSIYTDADIQTILDNATFIPVTSTEVAFGEFTDRGIFNFNRTLESEILYMIWDYTDRRPVAQDDYTNVQKGLSKDLVVITNDSDPRGLPLTVEIVTEPINGVAVVNPDNTITYTHDDSETEEDTIVYRVTNGHCYSEEATVYIDIAVACDENFVFQGEQGTFSFNISFGTATGNCGIIYDAYTVTDQFELWYDGEIVATTGGLVSGQGTLEFEKTTEFPTAATVVVTAPNSGTAWEISGICPNVNVAERIAEHDNNKTSE